MSRIAHCDEFVEAFEKGYDTIVGERGVRLSGGQRQRVAIARAILAEPADPDPRRSDVEPRQRERSADPGRPASRCAQGRTTFVIAHRLSTIRSADQILVLEARRNRRARHARRAAREGRPLPAALRQAVPFERDRFINPGEDFTPEPAAVTGPARTSQRRSRAVTRAEQAGRQDRLTWRGQRSSRSSCSLPAAERPRPRARRDGARLARRVPRARGPAHRRSHARHVRVASAGHADRHDRPPPQRLARSSITPSSGRSPR